MNFLKQYLKSKISVVITYLASVIIFIVSFILYKEPIGVLWYPALLSLLFVIGLLIYDYIKQKKSHEKLELLKEQEYVLIDEFPESNSVLEKDYREIINLIIKGQKDRDLKASMKYSDMVEYYTMWAHQIKTPIASMRLNLQNEDTPLSRRLQADLGRIEQYVEMVLAFLRLDSNSTDYVLKNTELDPLIKQCVRKFSSEFIAKHLSLNYEEVNATVITDEKWLGFVIEQVLSNAIKYTQTGSITIFMRDNTLCIKDTGIGILTEDLPRIFENGFTGFNGRQDKKASGIGLYLCKRICNNLGHTIYAESEVGVGTTICINLSQKHIDIE